MSDPQSAIASGNGLGPKGSSLEGPEQARARRERAFLRQIRQHGGTGTPADLKPAEACRLGVCLKCSGKWGPLYLHVVKHYRGLSSKDALQKYRDEFRIPEGVLLISEEHRRRSSEAHSKAMQGPGGAEQRRRISKSLRGRLRPDLSGRTGPKPSGKQLPSWEITKRLCAGTTQVDAAREFGVDRRAVQARANRLGLAFGSDFICDFGEPFRYASLHRLRRACGFEVKDFDRFAGLSGARSGAGHRATSIMKPAEARRAIDWRDRVLRNLYTARRLTVGTRQVRKDRVLKTILPELAEANRSLVLTMGEIRNAARKNSSWGNAEIGEFVCSRAALESSVNATDHRWRKTLRCLWQFEDFLTKSLDRIRGTEPDGPLVRAMIGGTYGVTHQTIQDALRDRTAPIEPMDVQSLILTYASTSSSAAASTGRKGGAPKKETPNYVAFGQEVANTLARLTAAFQTLRTAKTADAGRPARWRAALEAARFSSIEIEATLSSRSARSAAIRCAAFRNRITPKTGRNFYTLFTKHQARGTQSPEQ